MTAKLASQRTNSVICCVPEDDGGCFLFLQQLSQLFFIRVVYFGQFSKLVQNEGGLSDNFFIIEVALFGEAILEVFHVVFGLEEGPWMEGDYFGPCWRVLDEPVASSPQVKHQQMVELSPVCEMDSFVVVVLFQKGYLFFGCAKEKKPYLFAARSSPCGQCISEVFLRCISVVECVVGYSVEVELVVGQVPAGVDHESAPRAHLRIYFQLVVLLFLADYYQKYSLFVKVGPRLALAPVPDDIYVLCSQGFVFGE